MAPEPANKIALCHGDGRAAPPALMGPARHPGMASAGLPSVALKHAGASAPQAMTQGWSWDASPLPPRAGVALGSQVPPRNPLEEGGEENCSKLQA